MTTGLSQGLGEGLKEPHLISRKMKAKAARPELPAMPTGNIAPCMWQLALADSQALHEGRGQVWRLDGGFREMLTFAGAGFCAWRPGPAGKVGPRTELGGAGWKELPPPPTLVGSEPEKASVTLLTPVYSPQRRWGSWDPSPGRAAGG